MQLANQITANTAQGAYHDVNQLKQLTALSDAGPAVGSSKAINELAKQFESLLVHQMLKSMRSANKAFSEDSLLNTERVEFYQQMLDDQWSIELTSGEGLGFAKSIANQYSQPLGDGKLSQLENTPSTPKPVPRLQQDVSLTDLLTRSELQHGQGSHQSLMPELESINNEPHSGEPAEFIERLMPLAKQAANVLGVPAEQIVAQAALETGWGKHMLNHGDGRSSHNYFGIKADQRWHGERVQSVTTEFVAGNAIKVNAAFRSYESAEAAFADYVDFLQSNPRYNNAIQSKDQFASGLQQAGYATDPHYAGKIQRIAGQLMASGRDS